MKVFSYGVRKGSFFMKLENAILMLISIVSTLYLCNGIAFLYDTRNEYNNLAKYSFNYEKLFEKPVKKENRSGREAYSDFKKKNPSGVFPMCPSLFQKLLPEQKFFPLGGKPNVKTFGCNENGYFTKYLSDRYGFRNPDSSYDTQGTSIILLGDSFLHGHCVKDGDDIAGQLRIHFEKVFTFGCYGNGFLSHYSSWRQYGKKLNPKTVLHFVYLENDLSDLERELSSYLANYLTNPNFIEEKEMSWDFENFEKLLLEKNFSYLGPEKKPSIFETYISRFNFIAFIKLTNLRKLVGLLNYSEMNRLQRIKINKAKEIISTLNRELVGDNIFYKIIFMPSFEEINAFKNKGKMPFHTKIKMELIAFIKSKNIAYLDFFDYALLLEDPLRIFPGPFQSHYGPFGYKYLANSIVKSLRFGDRPPLRVPK